MWQRAKDYASNMSFENWCIAAMVAGSAIILTLGLIGVIVKAGFVAFVFVLGVMLILGGFFGLMFFW
jgi:hypothetical protein